MTFNVESAVAAHMGALSATDLAKAAGYTAGSNWMVLWGLVVGGFLTAVIIRWGVLDTLTAKLASRGNTLRSFLVAAASIAIYSILSLPWDLYTGFFRETAYGRTSQPLGDYLGQSAIGLAMFMVLGGLFFMGLYALMRKTGRKWWLWSGGFTALVMVVFMLAAPIVIEPIFNDYKPLPNGEVRDALEGMADEAGIPRDRIFVYDGSRQSNNFTANVSGVFGSARIAISDVALKGASLDEVKAVTGHEVGHYVLGHIWYGIAMLAVLSMLFFFLADRMFPWFERKFGGSGGIAAPKNLPILMFVVSLLGVFAMPAQNALSRTNELASDNYSLIHVGLPDALASALVKTAEYRNPRPSALQEAIFYTHPSVERRVRNAMTFKAKMAAQKTTK
jgi:STE24 endopeptidase